MHKNLSSKRTSQSFHGRLLKLPKSLSALKTVFGLGSILLLASSFANAGSVELEWKLINQAIGYKVYYGESKGNYPWTMQVGNQTTVKVSGLKEGKTYYFAITARDASGQYESTLSNVVSATIPLPVDTVGDDLTDHESDDDGMADDEELSQDSDPTDPNPAVRAELDLEVGEVNVDHNWTWVGFNEVFLDPVVIATPLSYNGTDPSVVRIRNVDSTGFEIRLQEWDYLDRHHTLETVSYLVMERGSYTLPNGTRIEAGRVEANNGNLFRKRSWSKPFRTAPVVLVGVSTFNEADAVTTRVHNINAQAFEFTLQEQELNDQRHATETVSYIAWEPSAGMLSDLGFEVGLTKSKVDHNFYTLAYPHSYAELPLFLAGMQTTYGADTATLRWDNQGLYTIDIKVEEEQSRDSETSHVKESVGYILFGYPTR